MNTNRNPGPYPYGRPQAELRRRMAARRRRALRNAILAYGVLLLVGVAFWAGAIYGIVLIVKAAWT